jgi:hypothetical protein
MSEMAATITRDDILVFLSWIARGGAPSNGRVEILSRQESLEILMQIARDKRVAIKDRVEAIRVHSKMSGFRLTEGEIWSVIATLANGGTGKFFPVADQSFLDEHRATLVPDGSKWLLIYPIACYEYGSRLEESVDAALPIVAENHENAIMIAQITLREHVAPRAPESQACPWTPAALPKAFGIVPAQPKRIRGVTGIKLPMFVGGCVPGQKRADPGAVQCVIGLPRLAVRRYVFQ